MSTSSITSQRSIEAPEVYEEEFTLMDKPAKCEGSKVSLESCLAYKIAQRLPPTIKTEVTKMVKYYETTLMSQTKDYHKLVEENAKLKKQNERLEAQNYTMEMDKTVRVVVQKEKETRIPLTPVRLVDNIAKSTTPLKTPEKTNYRQRIE
jgi:hypothetical protein